MNALVVEDQSLMLDILVSVMSCSGWFDKVYNAQDGMAALESYSHNRPKFLLLDIELPKLSGLRVARRVLNQDPNIMILLMSGEVDEVTICGINRLHGLSGFLLKEEGVFNELVEVIPRILNGGVYFSKGYHERLRRYSEASDCLDHLLTPRQRRILGMVGAGWDDEAIAAYIETSVDTVRWHVKRLRQKLNVHSRCELITVAHQRGCAKGKWHKMELVDRYDLW